MSRFEINNNIKKLFITVFSKHKLFSFEFEKGFIYDRKIVVLPYLVNDESYGFEGLLFYNLCDMSNNGLLMFDNRDMLKDKQKLIENKVQISSMLYPHVKFDDFLSAF